MANTRRNCPNNRPTDHPPSLLRLRDFWENSWCFMLNFSHSDLNLFSPRAYVVFKTKGNALHLHLSVTILLCRYCLYFSHFGRDRLLQLACLSCVGVLVHRSLCAAKIQRDTYSGLISQLQLSP